MSWFNRVSVHYAIFCIASLFSISVSAAYTESVDGDLSGDFLAPTLIATTSGSNIITGSIGDNGNTGATNGQDADYFSFDLAANETLTEINILSFLGSNNVSFFGYVEDSAFNGQGFPDLDGSAFINDSSGNIINSLIGGSITDTSISFWLQETAPVQVDYSIEFVIATTPVPVPGAIWFFATSICGLVMVKRKR